MGEKKQQKQEEKEQVTAPTGFDIDAKNPDAEGKTNKQSFERIRGVAAVDGLVLMLVDSKAEPGTSGVKLQSALMNVKEAAERAFGLNRMISVIPEVDKAQAFELVEETIARIKEAKAQQLDPKVQAKASKVKLVFGEKDMEEILGKSAYSRAVAEAMGERRWKGEKPPRLESNNSAPRM